ncbi:MAG TPA: tetratricopeptide repeat protein [Allosphingosinicella sp.]|nr:tetratricopeptide repeat protein [Allosphingosinicella sp.]
MSQPASSELRRLQPATIALALAALLALGVLVYTIAFRQDGAAAAPTETNSAAANGMAATGQAASVEEMIAGLVERVRRDPDDHEGWFRLGMAYRVMDNFPQATQAFRRAMELQPRNADYVGYLGEALLIQGTRANQPPPPESATLFRRALELQPGHPQARFYLATIRDVQGDHRGAIDDLIALLRDAPPGAEWAGQVRNAVQAIAQTNNIDIAGRLPAEPVGTAAAAAPPAAPAPSAATAGIPGPTPEQMRAASGMTPTQQNAMGRDMVERLGARLRQNPRDADRWMMMMRSRMVLNEPQLAAQALRDSLAAFNGDTATQNRLRQAARELGVPGS